MAEPTGQLLLLVCIVVASPHAAVSSAQVDLWMIEKPVPALMYKLEVTCKVSIQVSALASEHSTSHCLLLAMHAKA